MKRIQIGNDSGGWRDYLDGKPIHCGEQLQMWNSDEEKWEWARYEMGDRRKHEVLLVNGEGEWWLDRDTMLFRWPEEENVKLQYGTFEDVPRLLDQW